MTHPTGSDDDGDDDFDPRDPDTIADTLVQLLKAVHPDDDEMAWGLGWELLAAYDEDAALAELGYLYARAGAGTVARVAERLGVDLAVVDDPFGCPGCGLNTARLGESYMVKDEVWSAAGSKDGWWCIGCLEGLIGRRLEPNDFESVPLTTDQDHSRRLYERLFPPPSSQTSD